MSGKSERSESVVKTKYAVIAFIAALVISLGAMAAGVYFKVTSDDKVTSVQEERINETKVRQRQFCRLFVNIRQDKVRRYQNTLVYLNTDAGHEPTAINLYIRQVSLPQTRLELTKEAESLPAGCFKDRKKERSNAP